MEAESTILVRVEEANEAERFRLADAEVALITKVVQELERADKSVAVPVKSLEGGVGCEVADGAKALTSSLKASFAITDCDEQLLQSTLRLKSKAHFPVLETNREESVLEDELGKFWRFRTQVCPAVVEPLTIYL